MLISGIEKVAIFIMSLNEDNAKQIINALDQDELNAISVAMTKLGNIDSETVEKVLISFAHDLNQSLNIIGNSKTAEKFLSKVLDEQKFNTVLEKIRNANTNTVWEMISNLDDESVAQFIKNEYPQTAAVILTKLPSYKAAKILKMLNSEYAVEVLRRMMYLDTVKVEALHDLEQVLETQLKDKTSAFNVEDNTKVIAEIFNSFSKDDEQLFMNSLKERDPIAADKVSKMMMVFDDLIFIKSNGIQALMQKIDNSTLIIGLSGASEGVREIFLNSMSQRVARMISEEISAGVKNSKKEIFEAQSKILKVVKAMVGDGTIMIDKRSNV
jgi:flagellar motor switch protein FliG